MVAVSVVTGGTRYRSKPIATECVLKRFGQPFNYHNLALCALGAFHRISTWRGRAAGAGKYKLSNGWGMPIYRPPIELFRRDDIPGIMVPRVFSREAAVKFVESELTHTE